MVRSAGATLAAAVAALALLLVASPAARAHPHTSPTIWTNYEVKAHEVFCSVYIRRDMLTPWVGPALAEDAMKEVAEPLAPERRRALLRAAASFMENTNPVEIDGRATAPVAQSLESPETDDAAQRLEYVVLAFAYPCRERARQVRMLWRAFEDAEWQGVKSVPGLLIAAPDVEPFEFSPGEPEFVWHAPEGERSRILKPVAAPPDPRLRLPLASLGAALALLLAWGALARTRPQGAWSAALVVAGGLSFVGLLDVGVLRVPRPWTDALELPTDQQAGEIFATLQDNIYEAFGAGSADEIYELLSVSVDAAILDDLFADIYESLILREQGGAVTRVERVEVLESHVDFPAPERRDEWPPRFFVDWHWRVHCAVTHWGHTHRRINEYRARYTVRHDGRSWKIAGVEVKDHKRLDLDADASGGGAAEFR